MDAAASTLFCHFERSEKSSVAGGMVEAEPSGRASHRDVSTAPLPRLAPRHRTPSL